MMHNTSEVLDLSKENVQPLRQGRKAAHLKTALQAQTDPETQILLQKQRDKFVYQISTYEGDDPLELYWNYVTWLEQSFTKLNRESGLIQLLEEALPKFKDHDKYKQDSRFVQLLVKYIQLQSNPLELYQAAYNQGLGTMCSALYKAWAEELDKSNDFKRADQIYKLGIQCRAQPLKELEDAHIQFQLSVGRRMLEGNILNSDQGNENGRSALSKLQPSKVKTSRISRDTAGVFQLTTRNSDSKNNAASMGKFKVYQEDECDEFVKTDTRNKTEKLPKGSVADRENIMKASKWCGQKQKQSSVFRSSMPTTPSFQIHEDPDADCENLKTVIRPRALKIRKEELRCPVAVFEKPDPTKKPMYPKHLVYVGGRDIQLEELRAAMYWKRLEREEQEKAQQLEKIKESRDVVSNQLKTPNRALVDYHGALSDYPFSTTGSSTADSAKHPTQPLKSKTEESHSINETSGTSQKNETSEKNVSAEVDALVGLSERGSVPPLCSPSTSFTVNTRAAMNVIQQMWESPLPPPSARRQKSTADFEDSLFKVPLHPASSQKENSKPAGIPFPVFCDDADQRSSSPPRRALPEKLAFPVFCDEDTKQEKYSSPFPIFYDDQPPSATHRKEIQEKLSFPVFCDENADQPRSPPVPRNEQENKLSFPVFTDENPTPEKYSIPFIVPVNLADTPLEPENKENCPPKSYATPIERRPLSGILTPATDVPVKETDSEDSEDDDDYCKVLRRRSSDFDDETCSTKAFAIALPSSTPFARPHQLSSSRKSLIHNGSYIEDNSVKSNTENSKYVNGQHLSLILENSKEQGSNSSGGSSAVSK